MSRIGKQPVVVPGNVKVEVQGQTVRVEGPKGKLQESFRKEIGIKFDGDKKALIVSRSGDDREARALHGLTRALIQNMVKGVVDGFEKKLKIEGIGYQARKDKNKVVLTVGYANAVEMTPPEGVTVDVPDPTTILVRGADKQKVGQFAAEVRASRKPEPYKGKGIRYDNEVVRRKEGKSFASGAA
jgi:large subunit ribosomal protein L6